MSREVKQVRNAARQMVRELQLLDRDRCIAGFSFSECHLVSELCNLGEATAKELGRRLVLEKSTMSRLVNGLVKTGHVAAMRDPDDGRRKLLFLTEKGIEGARRVNRYAIGQVSDALANVGQAEQAEIAAGLEKYARALRYARLSSRYQIRPIEARDNPEVAAIIRKVMTEFGAVGCDYSIADPEVDAMYQAYPAPAASYYVVKEGDRILGCGGMAALTGGEPGICELRKMYFLPELRGSGMGTRLLQRILNDARRAGYSDCYLETLDQMEGARYLYGKHGFREINQPLGKTGHSGCNSWMLKSL